MYLTSFDNVASLQDGNEPDYGIQNRSEVVCGKYLLIIIHLLKYCEPVKNTFINVLKDML